VAGHIVGGAITFVDTSGATQGTQTHTSPSAAFVAVYEPNGVLAWSARIESTSILVYQAVADSNGNITVLGFFYNTDGIPETVIAWAADGITTMSRTGYDGANLFLVQYSPTGTIRWMARLSLPTDPNNQELEGSYMRVLNGTDIVIAGYYSVASVDSALEVYDASEVSTLLPITAGDRFLFLVRYSQLGAVVFATSVATPPNNETLTPTGLDIVGSTIMVTGYGQYTTATAGGTITLNGAGPSNVDFTFGFTTVGVPLWGRYVDPTTGSYLGAPYSRTRDQSAFTGITTASPIHFRDEADNSLLTPIPTTSPTTIYLAMLTAATGAHQWATKIDGTIGNNYPLGIVQRVDGTIFMIIQQFSDSMYFYNAPGTGGPITTASKPVGPPTQMITICAFSPAGIFLWARTCSTGSAFDIARISLDIDGNPLVFFTFDTVAQFYADESSTAVVRTVMGEGFFDNIMAKYSAAGTLLWAGHVGTIESESVRWMESTQTGGAYTLTWNAAHPVNIVDANDVARFTYPNSSVSYTLVRWSANGV
jgi:hypothetical protein